MLGAAEVTVVSDGPLPLGPPKGTFTGASDDEIKKMLTDNFLSPDNIVLEQNSPIVNMGDKLVLFDTGMGTSQAFGPTTGRQQKSMAEAGIKPEDIDAVVFSHAHIDHIGGVVDSSGKVLFPNAQFYIAQSDLDYWTDEGKMGGPLEGFCRSRPQEPDCRSATSLVFYKDGQEFLPGIQALAAPGHTVGHTMFMVTSDGKSFAFLGDLTHHQILLMEHPRMEFSYDTDPKQAAESRVKMLDMLAANKIPVMSYHYPWPGYGHVAKTGEGFPLYPRADADVALSGSRRGGGPLADPRRNHAQRSPTHGWRVSRCTAFAGFGKFGSAKAPAATAVSSGARCGFQNTVEPQSGQKWKITGNPLSPTRMKTLERPWTLTSPSRKNAAMP